MATLNIDDRLARISETQGELLVQVIDGAFRDIGLTGAQREVARRAVATRLRAVSGPTGR